MGIQCRVLCKARKRTFQLKNNETVAYFVDWGNEDLAGGGGAEDDIG